MNEEYDSHEHVNSQKNELMRTVCGPKHKNGGYTIKDTFCQHIVKMVELEC
jgi:hypothetical protein